MATHDDVRRLMLAFKGTHDGTLDPEVAHADVRLSSLITHVSQSRELVLDQREEPS